METTPVASRRPSFLLSALVHVIMITLAIRTATWTVPPAVTPPVSPKPQERRRTVFLPPPAELRKMLPPVQRPAPGQPEPPPTVPPRLVAPEPSPLPTPTPSTSDGIRVGSRNAPPARQPLILPRDQDLASGDTPLAGRPGAAPTPTPEPERLGREERAGIGGPGAQPEPVEATPGRVPRAGVDDDLPLGPDGRPRARPGVRPTTPTTPGGQRSITESLRRLDQQLGQAGTSGTAGVSGQQMGPLFFDPEGADFTAWINHFKNEVYRNWIVPPSVGMGVRGHVEIEFRIERDGKMAALRVVRGSGTQSLDRAAVNALMGSRALGLPADYRPDSLVITVTFFYNERG